MSIRYRAADGTETICAGLTPGGDIEAGAVATRTGTYDLSGTNWVKQNIVFDSPMPDADYEIITEEHQCAGFTSGQFLIENKTANGFTIGIYFTSTTAANNRYTGTWKAVKTYSVQHAAQNAEDIANIKAVIPPAASSTNQLTPKKYVDDADTALDGRVSDLEDLIPTNASVTNQLATKAEIDNVYTKIEVDAKLNDKQDILTFDNEPTAGSNNPVKSNGIKSALNVKQDILTFDTTPTAGSSNPVTSGGIYNAIQNGGMSQHYFMGTGMYDRPYLPRTITINKTGHNVLIVTPHMGSDSSYQSNYTSVVFDISSQLYMAGTNLNAVFPSYNETTHMIEWYLIHFADVTAVTQDTFTLSTEGAPTGYPWFHIHVI